MVVASKYRSLFHWTGLPFQDTRALRSFRSTSTILTFQMPSSVAMVFPTRCRWQSYRVSPTLRLVNATDISVNRVGDLADYLIVLIADLDLTDA
jgi:hypothetical protein